MKETAIHLAAAAAEVRRRSNRTKAAVTRCTRAYDKALAETKNPFKATRAFLKAMPEMDTVEHIHAYIACLVRGLDLGIITGHGANQNLYAAQVALSALQASKRSKEQAA